MVYGDAIQIIKAINELKIDNKIVEYALWPNHPDYDIYGLKDLQRATVYTDPGTGKIYMFDQEFQGVPMTSTDSKWGMDIINKSIDPDLVWYRYDRDHRTWGLRCDYASDMGPWKGSPSCSVLRVQCPGGSLAADSF
jgi:hypothetical protein